MPNDFAVQPAADNVLELRLPKRSDADYEIEAVSKALTIMEALVEEQPVTERVLAAKLDFNKDLVMRTLRTFRLRGYAVRDDRTLEWRVGPRLMRLAGDVSITGPYIRRG